MSPFIFAAAARRQRSSSYSHSLNSSNSSQDSFHSSHSSHGTQNNTDYQHYGIPLNTTSHNQAGGMPLGDLEAGHGQVTYPHLPSYTGTSLPPYTGTPLPSTPAPSYTSVPFRSDPVPNDPVLHVADPHPYVAQSIEDSWTPAPPSRHLRRRKCCSAPCCGPQENKCCTILICFLACVVVMCLFPFIVTGFRKDGHKEKESKVHCRGVAVVAAAGAAAVAATAAGNDGCKS